MINNVVMVLGGQQRDSAIGIHVSILPQTPLQSRLLCDTGQRSLRCPAGPCWFSMLNTAVCPCPSQTPCLSLPPSFPLVTIRFLQRIEQSSLCWTAGPCWFSTLNTAVCPRLSGAFTRWGRTTCTPRASRFFPSPPIFPCSLPRSPFF